MKKITIKNDYFTIDVNAVEVNKDDIRFEIIDGSLKVYDGNKLKITYQTGSYENAIRLQKHFENKKEKKILLF